VRETDWAQITALYGLLTRICDNPVVRLNHAVAVAMRDGAPAGLELLEKAGADGRLAGDHRVDAVRAHLLEMAGDHRAARESYEAAARRATNLPQRRHLYARAARLSDPS
jgi:Predicted RNA polymerase sigma factor containing a TPR repeat domain